MLLEKQDGTVHMYVRTTYGIGESVSYDRGKTWTTAFDSKFTATATNLSSGQTFPKRAEYDFTPTTDYANFFGNGDPRWQ